MNDLISTAIAAIEEYLQGLDSCTGVPDLKLDGYRNGLQVAIQELKGLSTVDAVPVVRCKDCEHYYEEQGSCDLHDERGPDGEIEYRFYVTPDWFCADGEIEND